MPNQHQNQQPQPSVAQHEQRRNRRHLLPAFVTTALAVYGTYQLATWAWNTWCAVEQEPPENEKGKDEEDGEPAVQQQQQQQPQQNKHQYDYDARLQQKRNRRLQIRMARRCRHEIVTTLTALSTKILRRRIEDTTDVSANSLKELRGRRRDREQLDEQQQELQEQQEATLWMKLQVETITRVMVTAYAHALLFVVLTVQVHLLSGHLYRLPRQRQHQQLQHDADATNDATSAAAGTAGAAADDQDRQHHQATAVSSLLACYDAFFWSTGLDDLLVRVRQAVAASAVASDWRIRDPDVALHMTLDRFLATVRQIRAAVERDSSLLQRFIVANSSNSNNSSNNNNNNNADCPTNNSTDKSNSMLLDEMHDLLESPVVADAVKDCLDCTFDLLQTHHWAPMFVAQGGDVPLARVVAQVKKSANSFYENADNGNDAVRQPIYTAAMEQLPSVTEAAAVSFGE